MEQIFADDSIYLVAVGFVLATILLQPCDLEPVT